MKQERRQINLKNIRITDSLFGSYVKQVSEKIMICISGWNLQRTLLQAVPMTGWMNGN